MNGDQKGDLLAGCFSGFIHYLPATDDGFAAETWLKDTDGKEIHTGQYWDEDKSEWAKESLVKGAPDNWLGIYPDLKDWDDDGDLDLIFGSRRGGIGLRINEGTPENPQFSATARFVEANGTPISLEGHVSTDFADLDGDGLKDLVCAQNGGEITWYRNSGDAKSPKFTDPVTILEKGEAEAVQYLRVNAADMNGDNKPDLLIGAGNHQRKPGYWVIHQK